MLQNRRRHLLPPWASLRSGARLDLRLVGAAALCRFELDAVSQHRMHDDREAPCESNPRLAHRRSPGNRECLILELQRPFVACQHHVCGLVQECSDPPVAAFRDAAGVVNLA